MHSPVSAEQVIAGSIIAQNSSPPRKSHRGAQTKNVVDQQTSSVNVSLSNVDRHETGMGPWPWILGGSALAIAGGIGAFLLFKPSQETTTVSTVGTIPPGQVSLD